MQAFVLWLNDGNLISAGNKISLSLLQHKQSQSGDFSLDILGYFVVFCL